MIKVKDLQIKVTYSVGISDLEIPKEVFDQLIEMAETSTELDGFGHKFQEAEDWLIGNICEDDCMSLTYEVEELLPEKN